jgi:hypothetical protein
VTIVECPSAVEEVDICSAFLIGEKRSLCLIEDSGEGTTIRPYLGLIGFEDFLVH